MRPQEIYELVKGKFPDAAIEFNAEGFEPFLSVKPQAIKDVSRFLKDCPDTRLDALMCLSGVDRGETLEVVYHLCSYELNHRFVLKAAVPKDEPNLPSVDKVWPTANWHERETFDLVGITFEDSQDLRRILLPPDWEGHPLRKDYEYPTEYNGMVMDRGEDTWPDPADAAVAAVKPKEKPSAPEPKPESE